MAEMRKKENMSIDKEATKQNCTTPDIKGYTFPELRLTRDNEQSKWYLNGLILQILKKKLYNIL